VKALQAGQGAGSREERDHACVRRVGTQDAGDLSYVVDSSESPYYVRVSEFTVKDFVEKAREDFLVVPPTPAPEATPTGEWYGRVAWQGVGGRSGPNMDWKLAHGQVAGNPGCKIGRQCACAAGLSYEAAEDGRGPEMRFW
jgi:hypothetical protein